MKYIIKNKETGEFKEIGAYPGKTESKPLIQFDDDLEMFKIVDEAPAYDTDKQVISKDGYIFTEEKFNTHLKIAKVNYVITDISKEAIIQKLNQSLGQHLDTNYPFWEQNKHSGKALRYLNTILAGQTPDAELDTYINNKVVVLADWCNRCRVERDNRENEYLTNDIFPSFEWEERPV